MSKCQLCKNNESNLAWQPFGPDKSIFFFTLLGSHYRGFPIIKICFNCKDKLLSDKPPSFKYKEIPYIIQDGQVYKSPF